MDKLEQKRNKAKEFLGDKWLLAKKNSVRRVQPGISVDVKMLLSEPFPVLNAAQFGPVAVMDKGGVSAYLVSAEFMAIYQSMKETLTSKEDQ